MIPPALRNRALVAAAIIAGTLSGYGFGQRSTVNLSEVREPLQMVTTCALAASPVDFTIVDGGRTLQEQKVNVANGVSWTLRSRHIEGAAIDFAAYVDGKITFDAQHYYPIALAFKDCSKQLNIPIIWGGDWRVKDLMHIELDRRFYP